MIKLKSSQLALDETKNDPIQGFAQHMIEDHTAASAKLKAAAGSALLAALACVWLELSWR